MDVRPRTIHEMSAKKLADYPGHFIVHVKTQAGTYIKEVFDIKFLMILPLINYYLISSLFMVILTALYPVFVLC